MKTYHLITILFCLLARTAMAQTPAYALRGLVRDSSGRPVAGASLQLSGDETSSTLSGSDGRFLLRATAGTYRLRLSFVGYAATETTVRLPAPDTLLTLRLTALTGQLQEVTVSTGYQELPKERATGSFVLAGNALLNRSNSTDILSRLKDLIPGLSFNNVGTQLSIRGQSTLFANADPLIVVDGFAYNQPINDLNPNDVESISVLKDAAAASIWGAKAGNGVIVITTKKGGYDRPMQISLNANVTLGERTDLYSRRTMAPADYVNIEKQLFNEGYYTPYESAGPAYPLSPVVETLIAGRDGLLSPAETTRRLDAFAASDARRDLERYFYRPSLKQQYALSLSGGGAASRYYFSAGLDKNLDEQVGNGFDRVTLSGKNTWSLLQNKLELDAGINYTQSGQDQNAPGSLTWNRGQALYPYAALTGPGGTPLAITHDLRAAFAGGAQAAGLLDWQYRPLEDLRLGGNHGSITDIRLNTGLTWHILPGLSAKVLYQYDHTASGQRHLYAPESYYARNLVNHYTQDPGTGTLLYPVPRGGIADLENGYSANHDGRFQLDYSRVFGSKHELSAIAGYEVQSLHLLSDSYRLYGYDPEHASSAPVDGLGQYTFYDDPYNSGTIPLNQAEADATDHYRSYYANAAYTYDGRLTLSGSARLDQSNLFGVRSNQKGVPLWSAGAAWNLSGESFYHLDWLPELKLRLTYGYNGNINKSLSAYTTARYLDGSNSLSQLPYAQILNPPNPDLRWERIRNINIGLDFSALKGRLSGTLEYYRKQGSDLIGSTAYPPSSGVTLFTGNTARTSGQGLDLNLLNRNLRGRFGWETAFFISTLKEKVTAYEEVADISSYLLYGNYGAYPLQGRPLFAVYSYAWAGLDPTTGDPQGLLDGQPSKDYTAIINGANATNIVYNGPSRPTVFGALRNTFRYGPLSFSANISYRLGYYFRRSSVRYSDDHGLSQQSADYALRWQQTGDEQHTSIPSAPAATDIARDDFYTFSAALVEKGDNIRLADLRLAWDWPKGRLAFLKGAGLQLYAYAANLGILWRANRFHLDPDQPEAYRIPKTLALGLRLTY